MPPAHHEGRHTSTRARVMLVDGVVRQREIDMLARSGSRRETSILGYAEGDVIAVTESDFARLADGVLTEVAKRFSDD
jgi:hypothetical protein